MKTATGSLPDRIIRWMRSPITPIARPGAMHRPQIHTPSEPTRKAAVKTASISREEDTAIKVGSARIAAAASAAYATFDRWHTVSLADLIERTRRHSCPDCGSHDFRRSRPRSVEWLLCVARIVPYRCYFCNARFFGLLLAPVVPERTSSPAY